MENPTSMRLLFNTGIITVVPRHPFQHRNRRRPSYVPPPRILLQKQLEEEENLKIQHSLSLDLDYNSMTRAKCIWTFPWFNLLKLNTDGSSKGNPGPSSFGGLIRDSNGRWLGGYIGKMNGGSYTALEAEIWSIFKGLCLIKEMNLSSVLIETDCQGAVGLTLGQLDNDHPLKPVVDAINGLMWEQRCTMIHTRRDGNHCADQLAKLGGMQTDEYVVLEKPPALLIPYLVRDFEAASEMEKKS